MYRNKGGGLRRVLFVVCLSTSVFSLEAHAADWSCTQQPRIAFNTLNPSQFFARVVTGTCISYAQNAYFYGAYFSTAQNWYGSQGPKLLLAENGSPVVDDGAPWSSCFWCGTQIPTPASYNYRFVISGVAAEAPGNYNVAVDIYANAILPMRTKNLVTTLDVSYTIRQPACSLGSAKTQSITFGTLNSNDFPSSQRVAEISLNCLKAVGVTATLTPTQNVLSGSGGISATSLVGLSMATTWADTGSAVEFNTPRAFEMTEGDNLIRLAFRPQLTPGNIDSPVGGFSSQYTLNITYP